MSIRPATFYPFGGKTPKPRRKGQGSYNQTSGIASRWVEPKFGQAVGQRSGRPKLMVADGLVTGRTPGLTDYTDSEQGALQRIDSYVAIKESQDRLAVAPPLPNDRPSMSESQRRSELKTLQLMFMQESMRGNDERMRKILKTASKIKGVPFK